MEPSNLQRHPDKSDELGEDSSDWDDAQTSLRTRIVQHYAWVATFDRDYAETEYRRVRERMPWLKL